MNWAQSKNYPDFKHLDTLILTSPQRNEYSESPYYPFLYSPRFLRSPSPSTILSKKSFHHNSSRSEIVKLPVLQGTNPSEDTKKTDSLKLKIQNQLSMHKNKFKFQNRLKTNDELLDLNIMQRTKEFMAYLNTLANNVPPPKHHQSNKNHQSVSKVSFSLRSIPNMQNSTSSPNSISLDKRNNTSRNKKKTSNEKKKVLFKQKTSEKKLSLINRIIMPHYHELKEQISTFINHLSELKEIVFNSKKVYGVLKNLLVFRSNILIRILLNEENECLNEPLLESVIENQCFIKEMIFDGNGIKYKEKMDPNVVQDFKELNEKLEAYNISHAIEKIKIMEQEMIGEFHQMKNIEDKLREMKNRNAIFKDYKPIEKYNYKQIPITRLVEELKNFEKSHGGCEHIQNRSRMICEAIETSVKNVRTECEI